MLNLVIVESPAKTAKIQGFLGSEWRVVATMGHIRALKHDLSAVGLDRDFEPTYEWMTQKKRALDQLRDAAKEATDIYLASDDDREGEGIAFAVATLLRIPIREAKRAVFHEITERAVKHAVEHPRPLDMNKVHSQQARAMLDMLVGFTISPLLWKSVAPSLSAGRCQTPALRLVVDREEEIESFTASSSWAIHGQWSHPASEFTFRAVLTDELADEESAMAYLENTTAAPVAQITSKDIRPWTERAPAPLITSSLQQQASAMFHINPKMTMSIAQRLYEAGKITYMRTDCAVLSEEATTGAKEWITQTWGAEYVDHSPPKPAAAAKKKDAPNAQEAHEAIRPVHIEEEKLEEDHWSPLDRQIYRLIRQRTLQSVMAAVRGETCSIHFRILDTATQQPDEEFEWGAQWKHITFDGWRRVGKVADLEEEVHEEEEEKEAPWDRAIQLAVGDSIQWSHLTAEPKETRAKGRFTEATLVRELESKGIGRPSTYASLLSTIQERGYIAIHSIPAKTVQVNEYTLTSPGQWPPTAEKKKKQVGAEKNKVVPTALGRSVLHYLLTHFEDLFAYAFTAEMEKQLDRVAKGETPWKQPLRELWESYRERHTALTAGPSAASAAPAASEKVRVLSADGNLKAVQSKKGPLLLREGNPTQFIGWPKGARWDQITEAEALAFEQEERARKAPLSLGEYDGQPIFKRDGQFGAYVQCGPLSVTYQDGEPLEQLIARLEAKKSGTIVEFKEYSIRTGQYGPYIMKTSLKKPQFVSLPKGVDPLKLTAKEVENLYRLGMEEKKKKKQKPIPR